MKEGEGGKSEAREIVVFMIRRDSVCSECGAEVWKGGFISMENQKPLCLPCADLDHLTFLPRGDTALTRRSRKYSGLCAVVVRFSRTGEDTNGRDCWWKRRHWPGPKMNALATRSSGVWRENAPPNFVSMRMSGT